MRPGTILRNPGGGTSTIIGYRRNVLVYQRGAARFYVRLSNLWAAWRAYAGRAVSSSDLKLLAPVVFDSKEGGHLCNCTMLFMMLEALGGVARINGTGVRGDPFWVQLP